MGTARRRQSEPTSRATLPQFVSRCSRPISVMESNGADQGSSARAGSVLQRTLGHVWDTHGVLSVGGLLAPSGWAPRMLLNTPQCRGSDLAPTVSSAKGESSSRGAGGRQVPGLGLRACRPQRLLLLLHSRPSWGSTHSTWGKSQNPARKRHTRWPHPAHRKQELSSQIRPEPAHVPSALRLSVPPAIHHLHSPGPVRSPAPGVSRSCPAPTNKNLERPLKLEGQKNSNFFFFYSISMSRTLLGIYLHLKYHSLFISSSNVGEHPGRCPAVRFPKQVGDPPHRSGHLSPRP